MRLISVGILIVLWASATLLAEDPTDKSLANWPQWRGPTFNGVAPLGDPPVRWNQTENLKWKTPIEGRGHSTPIIWGQRIFLVTAISTDKVVPPPYVIPPNTPRVGEHDAVVKTWKAQTLVVMCLDRASGRKLWQQTVREVMPQQWQTLCVG